MQFSNIIDLFGNPTKAVRQATEFSEPGPIELGIRQNLSTLKSTKYSDDFDWSVYDRISPKLAENTCGSVEFKPALRLVNHNSSCSKCHYSLEIDAYGRGSFDNNIYTNSQGEFTASGQQIPVDLSEVRKIFYTVFETDKKSEWREILTKKIPLRIGSISDSFVWMDIKYRITRELLKILNFYRYPYIIFTKSDLVAHDDYVPLLQTGLCTVQFLIAGNHKRLTRILEPGAPSYERRLVALKKLAEAGIWTTARITPLFPLYPDGYYSDRGVLVARFGSEENIPKFPMYDDDLIPQLAEARVPSVLVGFVRLSPKAIHGMSKVTGIDIASFYQPDLYRKQGDKTYSDPEIRKYYEILKRACNDQGIRFNTCYLGNGEKDYYQYQGMWSNKSDCCDARGNVDGFLSTSQSIPWETRIKHAPCKIAATDAERREQEIFETFKNILQIPSNPANVKFH